MTLTAAETRHPNWRELSLMADEASVARIFRAVAREDFRWNRAHEDRFVARLIVQGGFIPDRAGLDAAMQSWLRCGTHPPAVRARYATALLRGHIAVKGDRA